MNLFSYCGNNPVARVDFTGHFWEIIAVLVTFVLILCGCNKKTTGVGAAPEYVKIERSNGNSKCHPNCYSYAIGKYDKSYNPGDFSGTQYEASLDSVAFAVEKDFEKLNRSCRRINSYDSPIYPNEYRIALRVHTKVSASDLWDYHFMVQTNTGCWAEKHGPKGQSIYYAEGNPETISWNAGNYIGFYDSEIVYFAISP